MTESSPHRYLEPPRSAPLFHRAIVGLTGLGISVLGTRLLYIRGRKSGQWRATLVNLLGYEGERYLVAPRGHTQWVRNLRAAGAGELRLGRRVEPFAATELADEDKPVLLRAYLKRWKFEVGGYFDGIGPDAPEQELRRIAPGYPVFRITRTP